MLCYVMLCYVMLCYVMLEHQAWHQAWQIFNLDADPHLVRWIAAFVTNKSQLVRIGNSLSPPVGLNGGTPQGTKLAPLSSAF